MSDIVLIVRPADAISLTLVNGQGPAGPSGGGGGGSGGTAIVQELTAAENIGGHSVVYMGPTGALKASSSSVATALKVFGISNGAAAASEQMDITTVGLVVESSWAWTVGGAVFVSTNGTLTQTPPTSGYILQVGVALSVTSICVDIKLPIIL